MKFTTLLAATAASALLALASGTAPIDGYVPTPPTETPVVVVEEEPVAPNTDTRHLATTGGEGLGYTMGAAVLLLTAGATVIGIAATRGRKL